MKLHWKHELKEYSGSKVKQSKSYEMPELKLSQDQINLPLPLPPYNPCPINQNWVFSREKQKAHPWYEDDSSAGCQDLALNHAGTRSSTWNS